MYGALLEDLKLALERNRADAALIQDLGASLSAYEDKLSLATARRADNISSNQNQDDPDDEDVEPASVFVRWHRGLLRVKGKLSTRHFRRYLLAKIEAFSAAR